MTPQELWQATLGELEVMLSKANFTTWFKSTSITSYSDDKIIISVPNIFTKEYLSKKYHQTILKAIKNITQNINLKEIEYKIDASSQNKNNFSYYNISKPVTVEKTEVTVIEQISTPQSNNQLIENNLPLNSTTNSELSEMISQKADNLNLQTPKNTGKLNSKYTFDTFIVGRNNELAHAASLAVIKNPGNAYNPLFIYGGVGLGKTHLMHAIGNYVLENNPEAKVYYTTCENFTNDYMNAVRSASINQKSLEDFNAKYRTLDIFMIDDIQFLSGKERTEEVFFNIFNELQQNNKQIVISSDRTPKAIPGIEQRLTSRFEWGMQADIQPPDFETKIAIINEKLKERSFSLPDDIIEYLANAIHNNVRELEGILNKIIAISQLQNRILPLEEIKQITSQIVVNTQKNSLTPRNVIKVVSEYFDISIEDICGPCRKKNLTEPRQIVMFLMREELKLSYPVIGHELGGRDHTTVIHACDKTIRNLKINDKLRQDINTLKQKIYF